MRKSVLVGVPNDDFSPSALGCLKRLKGVGELLIQHADPPRAKYEHEGTQRNKLLRCFLESTHTHLLQVDSDVLVYPDTLRKLLARDAPVVCAWFRDVKDASNCYCWPKCPASSGLHRIRLGCLGATLITRKVAERLPRDPFINLHGNDVHFWRLLESLGIEAYVDSDVVLPMEARL